MSELPPSALTMKPQDGAHQSMCLQLQNSNDFLKSSSASSSSSLSSSSPDSTYSLSSLDVELPEGMMGRKAVASEDDSGIQSPDCRPDDNDSSVSIYLDANEHTECDDQDNVTIIQNQTHESDNVFSDAGAGGEPGRPGSGDSSATEAQLFSSEDEESDDEEDDSFLSLRSADVVLRNQSESEEVQMCGANKRLSVSPVTELHQEAFQDSVNHPNEESQMCSSSVRPSVDNVSKAHQEAFQKLEDHTNEESQMCSSTMRPSVDLVCEFHQDSQVFCNSKCKMQRSTKRTDMDLGSELHHKTIQESEKEEQMKCSNRNPDVGSVSREILQDSVEQCNEENHIQTSAKSPNVDLVSKTIDLSTEKSSSQPPAELILSQTISPTFSRGAPPSTPIQNSKDSLCSPKRNISQNAFPELSHIRCLIKPPNIKFSKVVIKRFSRPNLKDVKPKIVSRATSAPRPVNTDHSQSAAGCEKNSSRSRTANRRVQGDDGVKKNRTSSIQARATTPVPITDSDSKPAWPSMVKKQSLESSGSEVVTNGCHVKGSSSKVTETLRDEKEDVLEKETSRDEDVDQVQVSGFLLFVLPKCLTLYLFSTWSW